MRSEQVETPAEFCEWLVSMNALSNVGSRGLVTLGNIIERADLALRAATTPTPQVVATVAELEALPVGTVLRLKTGALAERADWRDGRRGLKISGSELGYQNKDWSSDFMSPGALAWTKYLPAQVLYPHPTLDAETGDQQ